MAGDSRDETSMTLEGAMETVLDRIAAWQAAGLIDAATADRLRTAEALAPEAPADGVSAGGLPADAPAPGPRPAGVASAAGSFFGPTPTIVEMFGYLGALFLIAAWSTFFARIAGPSGTSASNTILAAGSSLGVAVLVGIGLALRTGDARRRRAGGAAILAATVGAAAAGGFVGQLLGLGASVTAVVAALAALAVASIGRIALPAVTTQAAVLVGLTGLGWAILALVRPTEEPCCFPGEQSGNDIVPLVILPAIGWLVVAVGIGLLGLSESRTPGAPAQRRAGLTRFWAGLVAVAGVATSVFTTGSLGNGEYGRLLEPWVGDAAILIVSLVLVERAFRRDSAAFIGAAAIGLATALTDFNFQYLSSSTDVGLLIEGLILIGCGFAADRLRRRIDRSRATGVDPEPPIDGPRVEVPLPTA
jgi:hypothetical protein